MAGFVSVKLRKDRNILFNSNLAGFVSVKLKVYLAIHLGVASNLYLLLLFCYFGIKFTFFCCYLYILFFDLFIILFYKSAKLSCKHFFLCFICLLRQILESSNAILYF